MKVSRAQSICVLCRPEGLANPGLDSMDRAEEEVWGKLVPYWTRTAVTPAGGVEATVSDVLAFAMAHSQADPDSPLAATQIRRLPRLNGTYMGLAWIIVETQSGEILWHNGGTGGFSSFLGFHPGSRTSVAVLTNSGDGDGPDVAAASVLGSLVHGLQDGTGNDRGDS